MYQPEIVKRSDLLHSLPSTTPPSIITIQTPAGYGKSTFAKQIIAHYNIPSSWITLHPLEHSWQALQQQCCDLLQVETQTDIGEGDPITLAKEFAQALEQQSLKQNTFLVIDDIHYLKNQRAISVWLSTLIKIRPDKLHIIIIGRELPALSFSELIAHQQLLNFNRQDLRFKTHELEQLSDLPQSQLDALVSRLDGWISGICLALDTNMRVPTGWQEEGTDAEQILFNRLIGESVDTLTPDRKFFLMKTSLTHQFDSIICREVFGIKDIHKHLDFLTKREFYLQASGHQYRYHDLMKDYLQERFKTEYADEFYRWHRELAEWFYGQDKIKEAIWHYVQAQCLQDAASIAEFVVREWHKLNKWDDLLQIYSWLDGNAGSLLELICGVILGDRQQPQESTRRLKKALQSFVGNEDTSNQHRATLQIARNHNKLGKYRQAINLSQAVSNQTTDATLVAWSLRIRAWALLEIGYFDEAIDAIKSILSNYTKNEKIFGRFSILQDLSSAYIRSGQIDKANYTLLEGLALRRELGNPQQIALGLNNLAYMYQLQSQYEEAQTSLDEALNLVDDQVSHIQFLLYWTQADLYRDIGRYNDADQYYELAFSATNTEDSSYTSILMSLAHMRIWQGQWSDARDILDEALSKQITTQTVSSTCVRLMSLLVDSYANGFKDTKHKIQLELDYLTANQAWLKLSQMLGLYLYFADYWDASELVEDTLRRIHDIPASLQQPLVADLLHLPIPASLKEKIACSDDWQATFEKLELQLADIEVDNTFNVSLITQDLSVTALGIDAVYHNGEVIPNSQWTVARARELFYYLHFCGATDKNTLGLVFWEDHDLAKLRNAVHDTIKRIRKAIPDAVIHDKDVYLINPKFHIETDVQRFSSFVERAHILSARDVRAADLYQRAYKLYAGAFLEGFDRQWVVDKRIALQEQYLQVLQGLVNCAVAYHDYEKAIAYLREAIQLCPYDEHYYQDMMRYQAQLGQKTSALHTFDNLLKRLESELQASPKAKTWEIFNQLIRT